METARFGSRLSDRSRRRDARLALRVQLGRNWGCENGTCLISSDIGRAAQTWMLRSQSSPREQSLFVVRSPSRLSSFDFWDSGTLPTSQRLAKKIGADLRLCTASLQLSKNLTASDTRCAFELLPWQAEEQLTWASHSHRHMIRSP